MQPVIKRKGKVIAPVDLSKYNLPPPVQPTAINHGNALGHVGKGASSAQKQYDTIAAKYGVVGNAPALPAKLVRKYDRKQRKVDKREGRSRKPVGVNQRMDAAISNIERKNGGSKVKKPSTKVRRDMQKVLDGNYSKAKMKKCSKTRRCKATIGKSKKQQKTKEGYRIYVGARGGFYSVGANGRKRYHHFDNIDDERPKKKRRITKSAPPSAPQAQPARKNGAMPTEADVERWLSSVSEETRQTYMDNFDYYFHLPDHEKEKIRNMGGGSVWAMINAKHKVNFKTR